VKLFNSYPKSPGGNGVEVAVGVQVGTLVGVGVGVQVGSLVGVGVTNTPFK
jgi:hypothetical protein